MDNTTRYLGVDCLSRHADALLLGKRCLIVTGRTSAVKSGALAAVTAVLNRHDIPFTVYNGITENPLLAHCREAGEMGHAFGADFVVAIGGGSPIDAAKAASVLAVRPTMTEDELYDPSFPKPGLPIAAVPLTAGTGSEVNRYAVLTVGERKRSFSAPDILPRAAFLDPTFLKTLDPGYTVSTMLDAFCHCLESYLSPKSTPASEEAALRGGAVLFRLLTEHDFGPTEDDAAGLSLADREASLVAAADGGEAIKITGTGFPHPLGYGLTLRYGIPHGAACGAFIGAYVACNRRTERGAARLEAFAKHLGTTVDLIAAIIPALADVNLVLSPSEISTMIALVSGAKNYQNAPYVLTDEEGAAILTALFG